MEKKQSSIDWYENKLIQLDIDFGGHKNYWVERKKLREQAKVMHKEEVKESYREGRTDQQSASDSFYNRNAESYYNETFGGEKQC
jgi:hypothetical protein